MSKTPSDYTLTGENKNALQFIEDVTSNPDEVQQRILYEILAQNANVEYLSRYGLCGQTDRETFKKSVPVVTYDDLHGDITRIANGDRSPIISSHPISEFLTSSGTSGGERKLMPTINDELGRRSQLYTSSICSAFKRLNTTNATRKDRRARCYVCKRRGHTLWKCPDKKNIQKGETSKATNDETLKYPECVHVKTDYTVEGSDLGSWNNIWYVGTTYENHMSPVKSLFRRLNEGFKMLDVEEDERKFIFSHGVGEAYVETKEGTLIIPNVYYTPEITMNVLSKKSLEKQGYLVDCVDIRCTVKYMFGNETSMYFGVNLNPLCKPSDVAYTLIPTMAYFEFLPVYHADGIAGTGAAVNEKENQQLVDLADVELGKEYELVVTTYAGLYRYRVGDLLRVVGFKNKAPQFKFICRKNVALSIDSEKTVEVELHKAVEKAVELLVPFSATLNEYTSYSDTTTIPGHYVIIWEVSENGSTQIPASVFEECCLTIEECLNSVYRQGRTSDQSIGPLEIKIVANGTFDKLMDYAISSGASVNQYKTPRCVTYAPIIELLNSGAVSSYFSPKCPEWFPGQKQWSNVN